MQLLEVTDWTCAGGHRLVLLDLLGFNPWLPCSHDLEIFGSELKESGQPTTAYGDRPPGPEGLSTNLSLGCQFDAYWILICDQIASHDSRRLFYHRIKVVPVCRLFLCHYKKDSMKTTTRLFS
jgi:hypothetical protein